MSILKKKNKKEFVLFNFNKDGPGVNKDAESFAGPPYTFKRGSKLFFTHFWKLISLNLMMLATVIPIVVFIYFYIVGPKTPTYASNDFATLSGIASYIGHSSPSLEAVLNTHSVVIGLPCIDLSQSIKLAIPFLFLAITFGWQNCGVTYVVRSMVLGDPVFIVSDYFHAVKRNLKQGFLVGLLDFACIAALVTNYLYYSNYAGSFWNDITLILTVALAILYLFMRFYIYLIVITFDMKTIKIYKNSLIFSVIGIKNNLMCVLSVIMLLLCVAALTFVLSFVNWSATGILIGILTVFASSSFIAAYSAYPIIDKYMIIHENEET